MAEDKQVVQPRVDAQRGHAGNEREDGGLHAAEQRLRHAGQRRREERPGVSLQIRLPQRAGGIVLGVEAQNRLGKPGGDQRKHRRNGQRHQQVDAVAAGRVFTAALPQILGNEDGPRCRDGAEHHIMNRCKLAAKPDARNAGAAQLADHDLVNDAEGGPQHALQRDRQSNVHQAAGKGAVAKKAGNPAPGNRRRTKTHTDTSYKLLRCHYTMIFLAFHP